MRRLIWGFAGRTYHIVENLMHWLKSVCASAQSDQSPSFQNIYILRAVALNETNISSCLHFSMQNIEMSCDVERPSGPSNIDVSQ